MKKRTLGRIAASGLAGMTAVSVMGISASAFTTSTSGNANYAYGTIYKVSTPSSTDYYTQPPSGMSYSTVDLADVFGSGHTVYVSNGQIYPTSGYGGSAYIVRNSSSTSTTYSSSSSIHYATSYDEVYHATNGKYYPNLSSLYAAGTSLYATIPVSGYDSAAAGGDTVYFHTSTGEYDNTDSSDAVVIYGKSSAYNYYSTSSSTAYYSEYDVYKVNGVYYPTLTSAMSAANNDYSLITKIRDYTAPPTNYFSKITGLYYSTYSEALSASRNSSANVVLMSSYDGNYYYDPDYYYYYYNGRYYYYNDPYYYYWLYRNGTTTSTDDGTTAAVGNRKGWTNIAKYLSAVKSGSSVSVDMNEETTVPSSVMSAIKGRNVTVKFVLDNGVTFTINGKDVTTAKEIDIGTSYNTKNVPNKLVQAAYKKNDAISTAQISIDDNSFGAEADITVKFSTKRAGYFAKLYRYNSSKGTLSLVDTAKVQSDGKVTFGDVTKGGDFVIVLY